LSSSNDRLVRKLRDALGELVCAALEDASVVEIMLNPDGKIFIERLGQDPCHLGELSAGMAEMVIGAVAHALGKQVDQHHPIVSGETPIGGHRFEGLLPPVVARPSFTIRRHAVSKITLDRYVASGLMSVHQAWTIKNAIRERKNIVVCGGTGSGKTTLTNAIIAEMVHVAPEHRLVILEDTAEIQCAAANAVLLRTSDAVDMVRLLKSTLRMRPDRIIVGEVRDGAALTLLKAWNTGHPGGVCTVHSNSARSALRRLEQLVAEVSQHSMQGVIGDAVDLVVPVERTAGGRRIGAILHVDRNAGGRYITSDREFPLKEESYAA
jgi:type IV secretion system protein VirB11